MQRDTLNTFICAHFTIMVFERIEVFHILLFSLSLSLSLSVLSHLPHSVFQSDTFIECAVYCIITGREATDLSIRNLLLSLLVAK